MLPSIQYIQLTDAEIDWVQTGAGGVLELVETTAPSTVANTGQLYVKSGDPTKLFFKDGAGTETDITAGGGGSGDVTGPGSATNNAIVRFNGAGGKTIQDYTSDAPTISDSGDMVMSGNISGIETATVGTKIIGSYLTASQIIITDGSKGLISATVATYPSLTELSYVKGLSSAIQTQLGAKAPTASPTFSTKITGSFLTASEILITNASKEIISAAVATYPSLAQLAYVKGVTGAIQGQIDGKADTDQTFFIGTTQVAINRASASLNLAGIGTLGVGAITSSGTLALAANDITLTGAIGRDIDNEFNWGIDNSLAIVINGVTHNIVGIDTGTGDNDTLVTQGYVDDAAAAGGANVVLSNLTAGSVAINTSLVSDTDNTDDLGTAPISWANLWLGNTSVITWSTAPSTADMTLTHSSNVLTFAGGDVVGLGNTTATSYGGIIEANLVDKSASETISGQWDFGRYTTFTFEDDNPTSGPFVQFKSARAAGADLQDGDDIGELRFWGKGNGTDQKGASIIARVDGTLGGATDMPSELLFNTSSDASSTPTTRLTLNSAGNAIFTGIVVATGFTIGSAVIDETELEILDGALVTTTELNIIDGNTSATGTTLADADRVVVNDAGVMKQVALTDFETYFESAIDTLNNLTSATALPWTGMKTGTDGEIPTFSAAGNPVFVSVGNVGQILTSGGIGTAPTFEDAGAADNLGNHIATQDLVSDTDITDSLGTGDVRWKDTWFETLSSGLTATDTLKLRGRDINGSVYIDILTITSNDTVTADLNAIVTIGGQAILDASDIGSSVQAWDAQLDTWATVTPSANGQSLVAAANYAAMRGLLDLEAGTDFYSISAADNAFQAKDADLTTIAGLTATTNNFLVSVSSAWASRTPAQVRTTLGLVIGTNVLAEQSIGITDNYLLEVDGSPNSGETARFTAAGIEGRTDAEMKTQLGYLTDLVDDTTPQLGGDLGMNGNNILFDAIPADDTGVGDITTIHNLGATIAVGELMYLGSAGKWLKTDASAVGTAGTVLLAVCLVAGNDTNATEALLRGYYRDDSQFAFTIGAPVYVSETAGDFTATAPTTADAVVRVVAFAATADVIYFNPSPDHITVTG